MSVVRARLPGLVAAALLLAACASSGPVAPSASPTASPAVSSVAGSAPSGASPAATGRPAPASATASPSATPSTTASPQPSPAATPDVATLDPALAAFATLVDDPNLAFRMEQTGSMDTAGTSVPFEYRIDIAGTDFAATMTIGGQETRLRAVDGTLYVHAGGRWVSGPLSDDVLAGILDPWQYLGPLGDLRPARAAGAPKGTLAFENRAPVPYQTGSMHDLGITGEITTLSFLVRGDGTPVSLAFRATSPDGHGGRLDVESTLAFSRVNERIIVRAPED